MSSGEFTEVNEPFFNPRVTRRGALALGVLGLLVAAGCNGEQQPKFPNKVISTGILDAQIQSANILPLSSEAARQIGKVGLLQVGIIQNYQYGNGYGVDIQKEAATFGLKPIKNLLFQLSASPFNVTIKGKDGSFHDSSIYEINDAFCSQQTAGNKQWIPIKGLEKNMHVITNDIGVSDNKVTINRGYVGVYVDSQVLDTFFDQKPGVFIVTRHATQADLARAQSL